MVLRCGGGRVRYVYVADGNQIIRKITAAGMVTTLAGTARSQGSTDGMGSTARFYGPHRVAVDGSGNVYVADTENHTIRKITSAGVVTTLAGCGWQLAAQPGWHTSNTALFPFSAWRGRRIARATSTSPIPATAPSVKITAAGRGARPGRYRWQFRLLDGTGSAARSTSRRRGGGRVGQRLHRRLLTNAIPSGKSRLTAWCSTTGSAGMMGLPADGIGSAARFRSPNRRGGGRSSGQCLRRR